MIKDTSNGTYCTTYSQFLPFCLWGNQNNAVQFQDLAAAQTAADGLNAQAGYEKFIGQNPKPR